MASIHPIRSTDSGGSDDGGAHGEDDEGDVLLRHVPVVCYVADDLQAGGCREVLHPVCHPAV